MDEGVGANRDGLSPVDNVGVSDAARGGGEHFGAGAREAGGINLRRNASGVELEGDDARHEGHELAAEAIKGCIVDLDDAVRDGG